MTDRLEAVLAAVPELAGRSPAVEELAGGLANRTLKVSTPRGAYVVKLFAPGGGELAVDQHAEAQCTRIAAEAGVGPAVVAFLPGLGALVREFVDGEPQTAASLREGAGPVRAARVLRRLHLAPPFPRDLDLFASLRAYQAVIDERGYALPERYRPLLARVAEAEAAMRATAEPARPCHNDLMPSNFIDVGGGELRLIDFEYSGNGDPCCDLGALWDECAMSNVQLRAMVAEHYGEDRPDRVARARLWAAIASTTWVAWAAIRTGEGDDAHDAWDVTAWAHGHLRRAAALLDSPAFGPLLDALGDGKVSRDDD